MCGAIAAATLASKSSLRLPIIRANVSASDAASLASPNVAVR